MLAALVFLSPEEIADLNAVLETRLLRHLFGKAKHIPPRVVIDMAEEPCDECHSTRVELDFGIDSVLRPCRECRRAEWVASMAGPRCRNCGALPGDEPCGECREDVGSSVGAPSIRSEEPATSSLQEPALSTDDEEPPTLRSGEVVLDRYDDVCLRARLVRPSMPCPDCGGPLTEEPESYCQNCWHDTQLAEAEPYDRG